MTSAERRALGMCGNCGCRPPRPGMASCQQCSDSKSRHQRRKRGETRARFLKGAACAHCGSTDDLQLDHIDPTTKVSHQIWDWPEDKLLAEYAKCQWLCAPCHRIKTNLRDYPKHGELNANAKLTPQQVAEIRASSEPARLLSTRYGVSKSHIKHIRSGRSWTHAPLNSLSQPADPPSSPDGVAGYAETANAGRGVVAGDLSEVQP